jgi:hypothetical protein
MKNLKVFFLVTLTGCVLLAAPGDVRTEIGLTWDHNPPEDEVTVYRVYEVVGADYILVAEVPGDVNEVYIPNSTPGRRTFIATAVNWGGESDPSNEARTIPRGQSPKNNRLTE